MAKNIKSPAVEKASVKKNRVKKTPENTPKKQAELAPVIQSEIENVMASQVKLIVDIPEVDDKAGSENKIDPIVTGAGEPLFLGRSGISVVIPYKESAACGEELKYALRSWAENFQDCHIILIGDKPDFVSDEVVHIHAAVNLESPQADVTAKLLQAIASDLVTDNFILTNDDIYLVNFTELYDIEKLKAAGTMGLTKRNAKDGYKAKIERTKAVLQAARRPIHDYATHTPFLFNKDLLARVIQKYKADQEPLLLSCLYFNSVFKNERPEIIRGDAKGDYVGYVYKSEPNTELLAQAFENRNIINHNNDGYGAVLPFLQEMFPDKCRFEL